MTEDRGQMTEERRQRTDDRGENGLSVLGYRLSENTECQIANTEHRPPNIDNLFKCGVGISQAAITPFGELKMCVMIDYPKYKILDTENRNQKSEVRNQRADLKDAWERLKELVASIKPDKDYKCNRCELKPYCKWCPAKAWLENKSFTICDPESHKWAEFRRQLLNC